KRLNRGASLLNSILCRNLLLAFLLSLTLTFFFAIVYTFFPVIWAIIGILWREVSSPGPESNGIIAVSGGVSQSLSLRLVIFGVLIFLIVFALLQKKGSRLR